MKKYNNRDWLKNKYIEEDLSQKEIAKICACTRRNITYYLNKFDIPSKRTWSKKEIKTLKEHWPNINKIEKSLNRSRVAIRKKARREDLTNLWVARWKGTEVPEISKENRVFLATFIDTDGSVGLSSHNTCPYLRFTNKSESMINKVNEILGDLGKKTKKETSSNKKIYEYNVYGTGKIIKILEQLKDEMTGRKEKAEKVLNFCENRVEEKSNE